MKGFILLLAIFITVACTESRIKRYSDLIEPSIGNGTKREITQNLGAPTFCKQEPKYEVCEYRTARGRNEPVPYVHKKDPAMSFDLTPYEHYDVIQVSFDGFGVAQNWEPIVLPAQ